MKKLISLIVLFSFVLSSIVPPRAYAQALNLPAPGTMVAMSPDYMPVMMKGVKVHPENPLLLDFILDTGKSRLKIDGPEFRSESQKLIKYFLASLTIKEDDLWVNLSPYEKDRMIPEELGKTELGRDMLVQDYVLKQLTASMIYPEKELGKAFWNRVYTRAQEKFGTSDIPVDTFNKVWIVADKAKVFEQNNGAYVVGSHLKVMLESDYEAMSHQKGMAAMEPSPSWGGNGRGEQELTKQVIREVVIPEIEKEVNQGQNFAPLRQMFYAMILASWYKLAIKDALLNQVYSNKGKTSGVLSDDPAVKEKIYDQYLQAYKKGVFNYIKDDIDLVSQEPLPRKYFSGGEEFHMLPGILDRSQKTTPDERAAMKTGDLAMITINTVKKAVVAGLIILGIGAFTQTPFAQHFFDVGRDVTPMETVSTAKGVVLPLDTGDIIGKDAIAGFKSVASSSNGYTNLDGSISVEYDAYYSNSTGDIGIRLKGDQFQMVKRSVRTSDDFSGEYRIYRNAKGKEFVLFLKMKKDGFLIIEPGSLKDPYIQQMMSKTDVEPILSLDTGDVVGAEDISKFKYMPAGNGYQNSTEGVSVGYDVYLSKDTKEAGILFHPIVSGNQPGQPQLVKRSRKTFDDYILEYRIYRNAQGKEFVLVLTLKNDGSLFVIPGMLHDEIIQKRMAQVDATVQLSLDIGDVVGADAVSKFKYMPAGNGYQNSTEGVSVGYDAYLSTDTKEAGILFHPVFKGDQSGQPQMIKRSRKTFDGYTLEYRIYRNAQGKEFVLVFTLKNDGSLFIIPGMLHDEVIQKRIGQVDAPAQLSLDTRNVVGTEGVSSYKKLPSLLDGYTSSDGSISVKYDAYYSQSKREVGIQFKSDEWQMVERSRKSFFGGSIREYRVYKNARTGKEFVLYIMNMQDGYVGTFPDKPNDVKMRRWMEVVIPLSDNILQDAGKGLMAALDMSMMQKNEPGVSDELQEAGKAFSTALKGSVTYEPQQDGKATEVTIHFTQRVKKAIRDLWAIMYPEQSLPAGEPSAEELVKIREIVQPFFRAEVEVAKDWVSFVAPLSMAETMEVIDAAMESYWKDIVASMKIKGIMSFFGGKASFESEYVKSHFESEYVASHMEFGNDVAFRRVVSLKRPDRISDDQWKAMKNDVKAGIFRKLSSILPRKDMVRVIQGRFNFSHDYYTELENTHWKFRFSTKLWTGELHQIIEDMASTTGEKRSPQDLGGIDLNARNMGLEVARDGKGVDMKFDPAMVAEFQKGDFTGVEGIILRIVPLQSPFQALGMEASPAGDELAKG